MFHRAIIYFFEAKKGVDCSAFQYQLLLFDFL
jgi:hypothetical protein